MSDALTREQLYHFSYDKKSTVKTVCLSSDALQLAMGCECAGKGSVIVFDASSAVMRHAWECDKPMWAVRFALDARTIAAAGFDMALTLYSTTAPFAVLQKIKYAERERADHQATHTHAYSPR